MLNLKLVVVLSPFLVVACALDSDSLAPPMAGQHVSENAGFADQSMEAPASAAAENKPAPSEPSESEETQSFYDVEDNEHTDMPSPDQPASEPEASQDNGGHGSTDQSDQTAGSNNSSDQPDNATSEPTEADAPNSTKTANSNNTGAPSNTPVTLKWLSPTEPASQATVKLSVVMSGTAKKVVYTSNAIWGNQVWTLGESDNAWNGYTVMYLFTQPGLRQINAQAIGYDGTVKATITRMVHVLSNNPPSNTGASSGSGNQPAPQTSTTSNKKCKPGEIQDCNGECAKATWVADGYCDDGSQGKIVFTCPSKGMDGNDCGLQSKSPCPVGQFHDCNGKCAKKEWVNDGICDDASQYKTNFMCAGLGFDGNDCAGGNGGSNSGSNSGSSPVTNTGGGTVGGVPYFYQYHNKYSPSASCQNTSIAMVLKYYGWSGTPDTITAAWGKNHAQSPGGLAAVFNSYAKKIGIPQRITPHTNGSLSGLKSLLAKGKPVIVHGYFTSFGHVLVVTGYDGTYYTVNDPAGKWSQVFKGGYSGGSSSVGKGIKYPKGAFEKAIATSNGSSPLPLWYHEITP